MAKLVDENQDAECNDEGDERDKKSVHTSSVRKNLSAGTSRAANSGGSYARIRAEEITSRARSRASESAMSTPEMVSGSVRRVRSSTSSIVRGMPLKGILRARKSFHGDLVCGVEGDAVRSAGLRGLVCETQARESLKIRRLKVQVRERGQVEGQRRRPGAPDRPARRGWAGACR